MVVGKGGANGGVGRDMRRVAGKRVSVSVGQRGGDEWGMKGRSSEKGV